MSIENSEKRRLKLTIRGAVQGVGFRPFIFRLATELGLNGWVNNSSQGVFIEVEGGQSALEQFRQRVETEKPPRSFIQSLETSWLDALGYVSFEIRASEGGGDKTALVLPDIATCPDCLREVFDPGDRRYRYPFTNCTNCGPRFSIIESLPYDRANTSMRRFAMCPRCQAEYDDPSNRRFHAQPNACPACGPRLELWDSTGKVLVGSSRTGEAPGDQAKVRLEPRPMNVVAAFGRKPQIAAAVSQPPLRLLRADSGAQRTPSSQETLSPNDGIEALSVAADALRSAQIVAVKGLGGFHLMAAAHDERAVRRLRERKHREEKPFALMFPSLDQVKVQCEISLLEERLLRSPEAPIVLLRRAREPIADSQLPIANAVAPGNPFLGVMLPYTPLHHLLLADLGFSVVATSGNLSDEPICTDEQDALERLAGIADLFLVHNRPIVRHVDDSIVRVMLGQEMVLRRARGYAPLPVALKSEIGNRKSEITLAVGAHLKNTVALAVGPQVFISQHIGDLETAQSWDAFKRVIADFQRLYGVKPEAIAADLHPDYLSTKFANETGLPVVRVQHHLAHVLACLAENELSPPVLGVSWDGTGYGSDGTVWGGEFFRVTENSSERIAHLRPFRLLGGDQAVKEPRRAALGLLFEQFGESAFAMSELASVQVCSATELGAFKMMLAHGLNSPFTSSAGRLFDAAASLAGVRHRVHFEGQAAMELEWALDGIQTDEAYEWRSLDGALTNRPSAHSCREIPVGARSSPLVLDWAPMLAEFLDDLRRNQPLGWISAKFHNGLVEAIVALAQWVGEGRIVLSGGCFQNRYLAERTVRRLREEGFRPYWHQRIPPNDGGIALGQIIAARHRSG